MVNPIRRFYSSLEPEEENDSVSFGTATEIRAGHKAGIVRRMYSCEIPNVTIDIPGGVRNERKAGEEPGAGEQEDPPGAAAQEVKSFFVGIPSAFYIRDMADTVSEER